MDVDGLPAHQVRALVINSDGVKGHHWVIALYQIAPYLRVVLWDPLDESTSADTLQKALMAFEENGVSVNVRALGFQMDGFTCGYRCAWFLLQIIHAMEQGHITLDDEGGWLPSKMPALFTSLVWAILQAAELMLQSKYQIYEPHTMGLVSYWERAKGKGSLPLPAMIQHVTMQFLATDTVYLSFSCCPFVILSHFHAVSFSCCPICNYCIRLYSTIRYIPGLLHKH